MFPFLSLRVKIILILACYITGILTISALTQKDLATVKEKLETIELAYILNSEVLEARRYEKNFLLYGKQEALKENKVQLELALATAEKMDVLSKRVASHPLFIAFKEQMALYSDEIEQLAKSYSQAAFSAGVSSLKSSSGIFERYIANHEAQISSMRKHGQEVTELSKELVRVEHTQILSILNELVEQLTIWSFAAIIIGIFMPLLLAWKIFGPLQAIKTATEDIAQGKFQKITVLNTRDEMQQVMEAFNTMVAELERRQDQLVQSQKLSSIGTLTAGIAHQLNNPLNNISTSCQIAKDDFATEKQEMMQKMLDNIEQETFRARDVVQGLLEFSRTKEFALKEGNILAVVTRAVTLVKSQIPAQIKILIDIPDLLTAPMDAQRMQEVLLNMLINASQAIAGPGTITLKGWHDEKENEIVLAIHDSGTGIPKEIKDRIFDPFYTSKEEGQGTGLGLSIAYGIIEKHRGKITVTSEPGEGATFCIQLPSHTNEPGT